MLFDKSFDLEKGRKEIPLILLNVRCILPSDGATTCLCGINGLRERFALIHGLKQRLETLNDNQRPHLLGSKDSLHLVVQVQVYVSVVAA